MKFSILAFHLAFKCANAIRFRCSQESTLTSTMLTRLPSRELATYISIFRTMNFERLFTGALVYLLKVYHAVYSMHICTLILYIILRLQVRGGGGGWGAEKSSYYLYLVSRFQFSVLFFYMLSIYLTHDKCIYLVS